MTRFAAPISEQIWDMKYRFKNAEGVQDLTVDDTWSRIADALNMGEPHTLALADRQRHRRDCYQALEDFKWLPAGRITAGAGTGRAVTLFNCFVMGTIPDSMAGIFDMLKEAALTMQQGGGIGYDFSTIRPKNAPVKKLDADASGPLTFMDVWDAMCRTVMSAGSRRGAMMATIRCDHPDIEDYIVAKHDAARLRMFNMSVLITDEFMTAVKSDAKWDLKFDGKVYKTVFASDLWNSIMRSTYDAAEPGVIFVDRINADNNLRYCETIASTNPCGEQPLPPYGACLLGSINLAMLVQEPFTPRAQIDMHAMNRLVAIAVRNMDNVIEVSNFPLDKQRHEAFAKRRIGLGVTGLANALIMCGLTYGDDPASIQTEDWMEEIAISAYRASIELAKEKGSFPLFDADKYLAEGTAASRMPQYVQDDIRKYGIRNALLTSIAPTGTISLYAGNVSSGIEPVFAYQYTRKVLQKDGSRTEELVEDYAYAMYKNMWESGKLPEQDGFPPVHDIWTDDDLPESFVNAQTLPPLAHVRMQAAAQKWVDSSISKTINCPEDIEFEDFKEVYMEAWDLGCKGCTTYRPNEITGSVLSVDDKPVAEDIPEASIVVEGSPGNGIAPRATGQDSVTSEFDLVDGTLTIEHDPKGLYGLRYQRAQPQVEAARAPSQIKVNITIIGLDGATEYLGITHEVTMTMVGPEGAQWPEYQIVAEKLNSDSDARAAAEKRFVGLPQAMAAAYGVGDSNTTTEQSEASVTGWDTDALRDRPSELDGTTYEIAVGEQKSVYMTVNNSVEPDGTSRPFEVFLRSSDPTSDEWMQALSRMISAIMRRPHDASFVPRQLRRIHSAHTGGFLRGGGGRQPSLVAAIGAKLQEHMERGLMTARPADEEANPHIQFTIKGDASAYDAFAESVANTPSFSDHAQLKALADSPEYGKGVQCKECFSYNVKVEAGCPTCLDCMHSSCG